LARRQSFGRIAEESGADYIFGLAGNTDLDALVTETADNLPFDHANSNQAKVRTYASFMYQAGSWTRPRKVVARLEGSAQHLYKNVYCQRGQMENLIKLADARRAIRDSADRLARDGRVCNNPGGRHRTHCAHPRLAADQLPGAGAASNRCARTHPIWHEPRGRKPRCAAAR
jgi:hypothetical protein